MSNNEAALLTLVPSALLRRRPRTTLGVAAAFLVVACAAAAWGGGSADDARLLRADPDAILTSPGLLRRAAAVGGPAFRRHCAACHGANARGDPIRGAPNLTDRDWLYGSGRVAEIEQTILYGVRSGAAKTHDAAVMPAFGHAAPSTTYKVAPLSPAQIDDVTQYVLALENRPADTDAVARGGRVFADAGGCYDCHAADGGGDPAIGAPRLNDRVWLFGDGSPSAIREVITNGRRGVCPAWSHRLSPAVIRALAVYVHEAGARAGSGR